MLIYIKIIIFLMYWVIIIKFSFMYFFFLFLMWLPKLLKLHMWPLRSWLACVAHSLFLFRSFGSRTCLVLVLEGNEEEGWFSCTLGSWGKGLSLFHWLRVSRKNSDAPSPPSCQVGWPRAPPPRPHGESGTTTSEQIVYDRFQLKLSRTIRGLRKIRDQLFPTEIGHRPQM